MLLMFCQTYLTLHDHIEVVDCIIIHSVSQSDIKLSRHSKLLACCQMYIFLHGVLALAESTTANR
jgi:hypothetical protein